MVDLNSLFGSKAASSKGGQIDRPTEQFEYFRLPVGDTALVRLVYLGGDPFFAFKKHTAAIPGKGKTLYPNIRCTFDEFKGKCIGCHYGAIDRERISTADAFVLTIIDLRKNHITDNKEGRKDYKPCTGERCKICTSPMNHSPATYSGRKWWSLSSQAFGIIEFTNNKIGKRCISCKTGTISILSLRCSGCDELIYSEDQLAEMKEDDIIKASNRTYTCPHCNTVSVPRKDLKCSDCDKPVKASIYDTNLEVSKVESFSGGKKYNTIQIEPTFKWEPIPEEFKGIKPYDFENVVFPLLNLDVQAKILQLKNPFSINTNVVRADEGASYFKDDCPE